MKLVILLLIFFGLYYFIIRTRRRPVVKVLPVNVNTTYVPVDFDLKILDLINEKRSQVGVPLVEIDQTLCDLCATHSLYMSEHGTGSHDNIENRQEFMKPKLIGEVVAPNLNTPESVVAAWYRSPLHKECILKEMYLKIGISNHVQSTTGRKYTCAILSTP